MPLIANGLSYSEKLINRWTKRFFKYCQLMFLTVAVNLDNQSAAKLLVVGQLSRDVIGLDALE